MYVLSSLLRLGRQIAIYLAACVEPNPRELAIDLEHQEAHEDHLKPYYIISFDFSPCRRALRHGKCRRADVVEGNNSNLSSEQRWERQSSAVCQNYDNTSCRE